MILPMKTLNWVFLCLVAAGCTVVADEVPRAGEGERSVGAGGESTPGPVGEASRGPTPDTPSPRDYPPVDDGGVIEEGDPARGVPDDEPAAPEEDTANGPADGPADGPPEAPMDDPADDDEQDPGDQPEGDGPAPDDVPRGLRLLTLEVLGGKGGANQLDAGQTERIALWLHNDTGGPLGGGTIQIQSRSVEVEPLDGGVVRYAPQEAGRRWRLEQELALRIDPDTPDGRIIGLAAAAHDSELGALELRSLRTLVRRVVPPAVAAPAVDPGGDGIADPGEVFAVEVRVTFDFGLPLVRLDADDNLRALPDGPDAWEVDILPLDPQLRRHGAVVPPARFDEVRPGDVVSVRRDLLLTGDAIEGTTACMQVRSTLVSAEQAVYSFAERTCLTVGEAEPAPGPEPDPEPAPDPVPEPDPAPVHVFGPSGEVVAWVVPATGRYRVEAVGAQGGPAACCNGPIIPGGQGGRSEGHLELTEGETVWLRVGGRGERLGGGYNGGGVGGANCAYGGGATDVRRGRDDLASRVVVAAGGGASFCQCDADVASAGGAGGGRVGHDGLNNGHVWPGGGGQAGWGGGAGHGGAGGTQGAGGGGGGEFHCGGGGGYYGGGSAERAGGGGGSAHLGGLDPATRRTDPGANDGDGRLRITLVR